MKDTETTQPSAIVSTAEITNTTEITETAEVTNTTEITDGHKKGLTGSTLKLIAIASMIIDHIGAVVLNRMLIQNGLLDVVDAQSYDAFLATNAGLYYTYMVFRIIGRVAFPIFCFLLVQGFLHTHNLKKYLGRIFVFALVSEIPFDLAFSGKFLEFGYQNVFFTLFFGVLAIAGIGIAEKKEWHIIGKISFSLLAVGLCAVAVYLLRTDYDILGVLSVVVIYLFRRKKTLSVGLSCAVLVELPAFLCLVPIYFYNGERGMNIKWIFYLFYPVHILLLYLICMAMGLGQAL